MKRLLLFTALIAASMNNTYAYDFSAVAPSGQTLYYNIVYGTAEVVRPGTGSNYNNYVTGDLVIPSTVSYNGNYYTVTALRTVSYYGTFQNCSGLTSVTIPNSVTSIGNSVFYGCSNLTSVTIPNSVTSIGHNAFNGCSGLTSVTIPDSVTSIGNSVFYGCSGLTSVTIGNYVISIGDDAFNGCSGLTSVTIPNSVTSIGNSVFYGCSNLTSVTIPNSVTSIGSSAFSGCSGLTSVTIPNSLTSIKNGAFHGCSGLTSVTIPNSVTSIGNYAFHDCSGLTSVTIPNSVTSIGNDVFYGCSNLTEVWLKPTIPPTLGSASSLGANSVTLVVPNNSYNAYTSAGTYYTNHPIYRDSIIVTAFVNDTIMGYVTGGDAILIYPYQNDTITLIATANYGYHFVRWDDNSTDNPLIIVTDSNITRTAIFERNQYHILATSDTVTHGKINISSQVWGDGDFNVVDLSREYLKQITLTAKPNHGYHFTHWQDGDTNNPRTFILIQDTSFIAYYDKNTYTLTFQSADTNIGVVNTASITGEYLDTTMLINATALPHYHFDHWDWGCWYCNSTENPRRFVIDDNRTYTAYFSIDVHTVNVQVDNIAHGTVDGSGSREYGQPITVSATPFSGYQFAHWSNGSTYNPYTFAVLEDKNLTAIFVADGEPWQDTVVVYDTTYVIMHDTAYINVLVHDTSYVDVYVHDTTTIIDTMTLTEYVTVHDTTYINVQVHDTTVVTDTVTLTEYVPVHDTTYINVPVHDTTVVTDTVTLTEYVPVHDTTYINVPVHDTTYINIHDTTYITQTDTVTNTVTVYDTIINTLFDTITNTVYDTTVVFNTDTLWLHDTVFVHDTIYIQSMTQLLSAWMRWMR